jgi:O-antigen/teichoic acid export membrane protein
MALTIRQVLSFPLNAVGLGAASVWLAPADFGVLAILTVLINAGFSAVDLGFTSALIQCKWIPPKSVLRFVQTYKLIAGIVTSVLLFSLARAIATHYRLSVSNVLLFPACGVIAWLQSERGHQSIRLQRSIDWKRLAAVEVTEIFVYNACLVLFAYLFRSVICFVLATAARWMVGATLLKFSQVRALEPNRFNAGTVRELLRFGLPYQTTTVLSMIQKSLNPAIVGSVAGVATAGLVNWSTYVASIPLLPLQPMYAFLFSVLSERQRQERENRDIMQTILRAGSTAGAFLSLGVALLLPTVAGRFLSPQWTSAVPIACLLLLSNSITVPSSILTTYLTAEGFSKAWLRIVVVETLLIWIFGVIGLMTSGVEGYIVGLIAASTIVLAIERVVLRRLVGVEIKISAAFGPALLALASAFIAALTWQFVRGPGLVRGIFPAILGCITFCGLIYIDLIPGLKRDFRSLWEGALTSSPRIRQPRALGRE